MSNLLASSAYRATPDTPHWQLALGGDGPLNGVVQQIADVGQCIRIILTTPKGSDPLRPAFGCDAGNFLDLPLDAARVTVSGVTVSRGKEQSGGHAVIRITWSLADMKGGSVTEVSL